MIEEIKNKIEIIDKCNFKEIDEQIEKSKKGISQMKKRIDNIIFCRIQKEVKKNDEILLKTNLENSNEIAMMRTLTQPNIIPLSSKTTNVDNNEIIENKNLYFLLSKIKSKNISGEIEPFEFWKSLLKFNGLEAK